MTRVAELTPTGPYYLHFAYVPRTATANDNKMNVYYAKLNKALNSTLLGFEDNIRPP
jgi:hypothetical protein